MIEKRPVVINDSIAIRSMCYVSLSYDHRVVDGAIAPRLHAHGQGNARELEDEPFY